MVEARLAPEKSEALAEMEMLVERQVIRVADNVVLVVVVALVELVVELPRQNKVVLMG